MQQTRVHFEIWFILEDQPFPIWVIFTNVILEEKKLFELDTEGKVANDSESETSSQEESSASGAVIRLPDIWMIFD